MEQVVGKAQEVEEVEEAAETEEIQMEDLVDVIARSAVAILDYTSVIE